MLITEERVKEFIQLYAEEFGEVLSIAEAREVASNICELYLTLLEPLPSEMKERKEKAAQEAVALTQSASPFPDTHSQSQ
jgi:hypothetical protein